MESIPLIASSIMSKKLAEGVDALVLDVKVGSGAFMKRQVDARRLAQMMVAIGRRVDKRVQALITDMSQPLGYAIGNALEIMEVSQTLQNGGPADLTRLSLELAARMIFLGKITKTLDEARELAQVETAGRLGLSQVQGCDSRRRAESAGSGSFRAAAERDRGARNLDQPRRIYQRHRCRVDWAGLRNDRRRTQHEGRFNRSGGGRHSGSQSRPEIDAGSILCRLYHTSEENLEEAAELVEDAFRISQQSVEDRDLILEVVS